MSSRRAPLADARRAAVLALDAALERVRQAEMQAEWAGRMVPPHQRAAIAAAKAAVEAAMQALRAASAGVGPLE